MSDAFLTRLRVIVGGAGLRTEAADMAPHLTDWRGNFVGTALAVVSPANVEEVSAVVRLCAETKTPIVPQGGNTGMVGGATPDRSGLAVVLSLKRMNRIRSIELANAALTVEAGCILQTIQETAAENGAFFPLSLAAEGSCTIGGNLSTNAGGTAVLRYGNARELVLGLEAVLPDGRIWHGLSALRKDNTGYDLKHLLMGAEGTLGIITAAVLKLYPAPQRTATALIAVKDPDAAVALLGVMRATFGDRLTGMELMSGVCLELVRKYFPDTPTFFGERQAWQVLVELTDTMKNTPLEDALAEALVPMLDSGGAPDAVIAQSKAQAAAMWTVREQIPDAEKREGKSVKHDISVPISRIAEFISSTDPKLQAHFPDATLICFGHIGDGNLHYNVSFPGVALTPTQSREANKIVYAALDERAGSISAEHGIGQLKRDEITQHKSAVALDAMRAIKRALDPDGIMNPGKVL